MRDKVVFILLISGVFYTNVYAQGSIRSTVIGLGDGIGIIDNNRIQFYEWTYDSWEVIPNLYLSLPEGHEQIFIVTNVFYHHISVFVDNIVKVYDWGNNLWTDSNFELPPDYTHVFGFDTNQLNPGIAVVAHDIVKFYEWSWEESSWIGIPARNFSLPAVYTHLLSLGGGIGIVYNNIIQIYFFYEDNLWVYSPKYNFQLPVGYVYVFQNASSGIGVVFNNKIQFFEWDSEQYLWVINQDKDFAL